MGIKRDKSRWAKLRERKWAVAVAISSAVVQPEKGGVSTSRPTDDLRESGPENPGASSSRPRSAGAKAVFP